ncbi:MAG: hypothetical protein RL434_2603 [Pseudomonadota bacterium]
MALTTTISQKELKRVAGLAYETKTLKVMLCTVGATGYTAESTVANWQSVESTGTGYVRGSEVIGTGAWDGTDLRYEIPALDFAFTCSSGAYSYDTVVVYINGETYVHSILVESTLVTIAAGQTQTYRIQLITDD